MTSATPNGPIPFWRTDIGELDNHRSTPTLPEDSDVVVIGAGFAAAAFVTHLQSLSTSHHSITVLEARQLCSGATGRNGGHLKPDAYQYIASIAAAHGLEAAAELADFEVANLSAVGDYIQREKVDCDFKLTRAVDVQLDLGVHTRIKAGYDALRLAGVEAAKNVEYYEGQAAREISGVKGAISAYSYPAGHVWPYKLIHHMFAKAVANGINLQTNTPVTSISEDLDSRGRRTVYTPRGCIKAKKIVVLTNAYTSAILPEYKDKIIPYRAICSRIVAPEKPPELLTTYALRFADWDFDYLIPRADGSIIVGGARRDFFRDIKQWYGRTDDDTVVEPAKHYFDGYMQRHFAGWEDSGAYTDNVWTGIMGYSSDRIPRIGEVPNRTGVYVMGGFTGHGMPQIFLCGQGLARMVLQNVPYKETGLPRIFEETSARLANNSNLVLDSYYNALQTKAKM